MGILAEILKLCFHFSHLWGWPEVPLADLHEVVDPREELGVDGEPAVELVPGLGHEALGELPLEHEHGAAEEGPVQEELEDLKF